MSLILSAATRLILPLMLLFSVFLLLRGHSEPGGGFVGGLVAAAAFTLFALGYGVGRARHALRIGTIELIGAGLLLAFLSGLLPLFGNLPFLTALWTSIELPIIGPLNTVLLFDTGVYIVVVGVTLTIIFSMAEAEEVDSEED
ncbi:MAG: Na(+)/H(+) antiporter subunit B [Anaerolineaceae bacterium]|nr:Na(+)/H(+) antiporter subunit B [Anaerolineaceae bacterium]